IIPRGTNRRFCEGWRTSTTWSPTSAGLSMPGSVGSKWKEARSQHATGSSTSRFSPIAPLWRPGRSQPGEGDPALDTQDLDLRDVARRGPPGRPEFERRALYLRVTGKNQVLPRGALARGSLLRRLPEILVLEHRGHLADDPILPWLGLAEEIRSCLWPG